MSYTDPPRTTTQAPKIAPSIVAGLGAYVLPVLTIIGLFVLIALHDLQAAVGVPLIAGIVGVHGGVAVANQSSNG